MKRNLLFGTLALLAGSLLAADSPKDDVAAAAKKLAEKGNYSWKTTTDFGPNSQFPPGVNEGKTDKEGFASLTSTFQDQTTLGLMKGTKVVVKTDEGWKTAEELTGGGGGGGGGGTGFAAGFLARNMQTMKVPAAEVEDLLSKAKEVKKDGDAYTADLTEDGAKTLATFRGRRGGQQSAPTSAKGTVKFWIKDGLISKYQSKVISKRDFNGEEREFERTATIEIKDVGTTKLEVPDEAKKKLS